MFRRRITPLVAAPWLRAQSIQVTPDIREKLSKSFTGVKEEAKGQALDLGDMAESARNAAKAVATATKNHPVDDAKFKAKLVTLNASMKAYNTRLMNVQKEARALQNDVDSVMKMLWGNESKDTSSSAAAASEGPEKVEGEKVVDPDFEFEAPTQKVPDEHPNAAKVETVEGEVVSETTTTSTSSANTTTTEGEIEIDSIEIEETADSMSITDITKELHAKGIDFNDCLDAKSLRVRYQEFIDGKVKPPARKPTPPPKQPEPPKQSDYQQRHQSSTPSYQQQQSYQQPNSQETGLSANPLQGERRQIDSSKYVWEVKAEFGKEKGFDPSSIDMWVGTTKAEDHKRIYEIPGVQQYPIQFRQKGDIPTNPYGQ